MENFLLPEMIYMEDFDGDFKIFNEAVYEIFKNDFVLNKPIFKNVPLKLKAHPYVDGKEYTYYHFTHSGNIENDRKPDIRRMERIAFPKPMIENCTHQSLKVWRNKRGRNDRILILSEREKYLVVLEDRGNYILPWTAYFVEYNHKIRKLIKEYETYIKTKTA